jgi:hypothetical protein
MTTPTDPTQLPYADLPDLREVFVDQARMTVVDGYCVKIELAVARPRLIGPNQSQMTLYPCARLVLSPLAAAALKEQLDNIIPILEQNGVIRRVASASGTTQ